MARFDGLSLTGGRTASPSPCPLGHWLEYATVSRQKASDASFHGRTLLGAANAGGSAPKYKRQPLFSKRRASRRAIFSTTVAVYAVVISKHLLGSATMPGMFRRPDGPCHFARKDAPLILFAIPRRLTSPRQRAGSCVKITQAICWQLWTPCIYSGQSLAAKLSG